MSFFYSSAYLPCVTFRFSGVVQFCVFLFCSGLICSFPSNAATPKPTETKTHNTNAPPVIQGDMAAGKVKSEDERCQECHGSDGNGQGTGDGAAGKFAKLAGQYPDYMLKQIADFRSGARKHDFMAIMAKNLGDADAVDIAAYFASQKKMQGDGSGDNEIGKNLFLVGDPGRGVIPCASCHGVDGKGVDALIPRAPIIGGQDWVYMEKQLQDWRSGERKNSVGGIMSLVTKALTDTEVKSLADYISGL